MNLLKDKRCGVLILQPRGPLTLQNSDDALLNTVSDALARGQRSVLVDLRRVTVIDASGIGELVLSRNAIEDAGGVIKVLRPCGDVLRLLQACRLVPGETTEPTEYAGFETFGGEDEAIGSFNKEDGDES